MTKRIAIFEPYEALRISFKSMLENYNLFHADDTASLLKLLSLMDNIDLTIIDVDSVVKPLEFLGLVVKNCASEHRILLIADKFTYEFQEAALRTGALFSFKEKPLNNFVEYIQVLLGERAPDSVQVDFNPHP